MKPLAIDLFCGVGGWTDGLLAEGYDVIGFDIERHVYGNHRYPAHLVLQDVRTLHGYQLRHAALIVASPPCQSFSYTAMPWSRAKQLAIEVRADPERLAAELALFKACFRIQAEASEWAGRRVPLIVENVRGAQEWVGRARWAFGSYFLWGDVPALMPRTVSRKFNPDRRNHATKNSGGSWFAVSHSGAATHHNGRDEAEDGLKGAGPNWKSIQEGAQSAHWATPAEHEGVKQIANPSFVSRRRPGMSENSGGNFWFQEGASRHGSKSSARKAASAMIAKIPLPLARHIGAVFRPSAE